MLHALLRTSSRTSRRPARRLPVRRAHLTVEAVEDRLCLSTVTLNTLQTGWWNGTGSHTAANTNYVTGQIGGLGYRNFAVFDLAAVSLPIVGAQLRLFNPSNGYFSPDPTETYTLYDISTSIAELRANGSGRVDIYNDLGSGAMHGQRVVSSADNNTLISTTVNAAGVAALNAARGQLTALGGGLTTISGGADQYVYGFTGAGQRQLVLELQDPAGPIVIGQAPFPSQLGPVSSFRVYFDRQINPNTFTPSDATLSGWQGNIPITGVAVVPNTGGTAFDVSFAPQGVTTTYVFTVGPDIRDLNGNQMDQNVDFIPGQEDDFFIGSFGIQGPRVTASAPANNGSATPPLTSVRVTFNTAMNPLEFDPSDVASFYGPLGFIDVAAVTPMSATQFDIVLATPQTALGAYTMILSPDIRDNFGNPLDTNQNLIAGETGFPGDDHFILNFSLTTSFSVVVPNNLATVEGNSNNAFPFNIGGFFPSMRYQQVYARTQFPGGGTVDRIRFRQDADFGNPFTNNSINVQISLGHAARPINNTSRTFAENVGAGYVTVFDGILSLSSAASTARPRPFDIIIDVANLFGYDPSQGDFLLDIRMRNAPATSQFDAAEQSQQSATIRLRAPDVNATTGSLGFGDDGQFYGLVTMFDMGGTGPAPGGDLPPAADVVSASLALAERPDTPPPFDANGVVGGQRAATPLDEVFADSQGAAAPWAANAGVVEAIAGTARQTVAEASLFDAVFTLTL